MIWPDESQIGQIQIELTNYCNAACPGCERNFIERNSITDKDFILNKNHLSLSLIKNTFKKGKWNNLDKIFFCGNVDEPTTNPELIDIIKYFETITDNELRIVISTNGGSRSETFWSELGKLSNAWKGKIYTMFCIDGLEDTNHLYRKNVKWKKVKNNWRTYINSGGNAYWQFIPFAWNNDQIDIAKQMSIDEGFVKFFVKENYHENKRVDYHVKGQVVKKKIKIEHNNVPKCKALPGNGSGHMHPTHGGFFITALGYITPCCWYGTYDNLTYLWEKSNIDKKYHNINYYSLKEIFEGPMYKWMEDNMASQKVCNKKCK